MLKEIDFCLGQLKTKWKKKLYFVPVKTFNAFLIQNKHHMEVNLDIATEQPTAC